MDIKITFDVTPKLADLAERVCKALERMAPECRDLSEPGQSLWSISYDELMGKPHAAVNAPDLPVETPEPVEVPKPAEAPKNEPDAKIEAPAAANDDAPAPEVKDETPAEPPKPKRSHHKKVEAPKSEPQPEPEKPAEPAPVESPEVESEPEPEPEPEAQSESEPEMSLDDVRAVCVQAAKAGKTKVVTDFLGAHNAQSLSKLDPKHYAELAAIVRAAL